MKRTSLTHQFVECIPSELADGVLYISITCSTAVHKCVCGCGNKVVTPITPADWQLSYNGDTVSLTPSIGNWGFPLPFALLDRRRASPLGQAVDRRSDRCGQGTRRPGARPLLRPARRRRRVHSAAGKGGHPRSVVPPPATPAHIDAPAGLRAGTSEATARVISWRAVPR